MDGTVCENGNKVPCDLRETDAPRVKTGTLLEKGSKVPRVTRKNRAGDAKNRNLSGKVKDSSANH